MVQQRPRHRGFAGHDWLRQLGKAQRQPAPVRAGLPLQQQGQGEGLKGAQADLSTRRRHDRVRCRAGERACHLQRKERCYRDLQRVPGRHSTRRRDRPAGAQRLSLTINPDRIRPDAPGCRQERVWPFQSGRTRISFQSQLPVTCCTGDTEIEVMNVDSSARHLVYSYGQLPWYRSDDDVVRWSPDGSTLLFTHHLGKYCASRVYTVPASGGALTQASSRR